MKLFIEKLFTPTIQSNIFADILLAIPRVLCGFFLATSFGASKFGMPWTPKKSNLSLFEVSDWFVDDVAAFGGVFALSPLLFAWLAAACETIGGLLLILGLKTRLSSLLIVITMLVAIFFQQWDNGLWAMLPALGFLWVAIYSLVLGSGRFGIDYLIGKKMENNRILETPLNKITDLKIVKASKIVVIVGLLLSCVSSFGQVKSVTFNLDTKNEFDNVEEVKINGNRVPLSWDKEYVMTDEDGDGVYSATINFDTKKKYVQFKFAVNGETELQGSDNRVLWFEDKPIQKSFSFNEFEFYDTKKIEEFEFTEQQIEEDIAVLKKVLKYIHPNLYRYRDSITLEKDFENLALEMKSDPTLINSFGSISKMVSNIKCSHTFTNLWNQNGNVERAILHQPDKLPFTLTRIGKRLFVDKNISEDNQISKGLEIISINGISTDDILTRLSNYVTSDGNNYEKKLDRLSLIGSERHSLFDTFFPIEFGSTDEFNLVLRNVNTKEIYKTRVASVSKTYRTKKLMDAYGDFSTKVEDTWAFDYLSKDIAKLKMGTFAIFRGEINWKQYIDSVFVELKDKNVKNLIVDIRGNEGGNGEIGRYLLSYALQKPLKMKAPVFTVNYLTIPDDIQKYISTWEDTPYNFEGKIKKTINNKYQLKDKYSEARGYDFPVRENKFNGQIYLITDSSNSSATQVLASYAKNLKNVTLVGQETGGNQMGINGYYIFFLRLPNTGIEIDVPVVGQYLPVTDNPEDGGIKPDIFVKRDPIDFVNGVDKEVNEILRLIKNRG